MRKIDIIMVHGKTHSGKGTFSEMLEQNLKMTYPTKNVIRCSLSTYIRNLVKDFYYEGDMDSPECREFMAKVYEYGTKLYKFQKARRIWEKDIIPYINNNKNNIVIIESFREKNDIGYFETLKKDNIINHIITVKIERPSFKIDNYINANHKSENDLNEYKFDHIILNDSDLIRLANKVVSFTKELNI